MLSTLSKDDGIHLFAVAAKPKTGQGRNHRECTGLADEVEIVALGVEVMATFNLFTDLDVANGARGHVVDIILGPREEVSPLCAYDELTIPTNLHKSSYKHQSGGCALRPGSLGQLSLSLLLLWTRWLACVNASNHGPH